MVYVAPKCCLLALWFLLFFSPSLFSGHIGLAISEWSRNAPSHSAWHLSSFQVFNPGPFWQGALSLYTWVSCSPRSQHSLYYLLFCSTVIFYPSKQLATDHIFCLLRKKYYPFLSLVKQKLEEVEILACFIDCISQASRWALGTEQTFST